MKLLPHQLALVAAAVLPPLALASGISAQTNEASHLSSRAALKKKSSEVSELSYRTASGSERDQHATFVFPKNQSLDKQTSRVFHSSLLIPLATARGSVPSSASDGIQKRDNEWGIWGGISFDSPTWIGKTPNARFGNVGLRYGRVLAASESVAFAWTIDVIPVSVLTNDRFALTPTGTGFVVTQTRESVYGFGAAPIGLKFNFRRNRRVQPFGHATGGFLYFSEQVPVASASQFNYTFDFSGGVQIVNSNRRAFTIGYKYQHISNGFTAPANPGVDVQMVFAGFSVFK